MIPSSFLGSYKHSLVDPSPHEVTTASTGSCHTSRSSRRHRGASLAFGTLCSSQGAVSRLTGFHPVGLASGECTACHTLDRPSRRSEDASTRCRSFQTRGPWSAPDRALRRTRRPDRMAGLARAETSRRRGRVSPACSSVNRGSRAVPPGGARTLRLLSRTNVACPAVPGQSTPVHGRSPRRRTGALRHSGGCARGERR